MKKIPSLFQRNRDGDRLVWDEVTPGCEWVVAGEGKATRKFDGTCCLVRDRRFFKRFEIAKGKARPPGFEPATGVDPVTRKQHGWVPVGEGPEDRWHREAWEPTCVLESFPPKSCLPDGTYELCGPKVQGNPERLDRHVLIPHGDQECPGCPRDFEGLRSFLAANEIEGVVFHHPDGRMCKVKRCDFGLGRKG